LGQAVVILFFGLFTVFGQGSDPKGGASSSTADSPREMQDIYAMF